MLVDFTVLNLLVEHRDQIVIDSLTDSLVTAALLPASVTTTSAIEHRIVHTPPGSSRPDGERSVRRLDEEHQAGQRHPGGEDQDAG